MDIPRLPVGFRMLDHPPKGSWIGTVREVTGPIELEEIIDAEMVADEHHVVFPASPTEERITLVH